MVRSISDAFNAYATDVRPTLNQWQTINSRFSVARGLLQEKFASTEMPLHRIVLMGSAAKGTIIRPIDDVDAMAVFSNAPQIYKKFESNSQGFLYLVRAGLAHHRVETVGSRGQAVRLFYVGGGHLDIAPVLTARTGFLLPAGDGTWITTDPESCTSWLNAKDTEHSSNLKPLILFLKKWNRAHSSRLRSFHLETMAASMFTTLTGNQRSNLRVFFSEASKWLAVQDPAGHSGRLDAYLTDKARQEVVVSFDAARKRAIAARDAELAGNDEEAMRLWRISLGEDFPAYS